MNINFAKFLRILILLIFHFLIFNKSYSEVISNFKITGNDRITNETIIMFSNLQIGDNVDQNKLNNSLKELFSTNYFSDLSLSINNGVVYITVEENPIIQSIQINGIDSDTIKEQIIKVTRTIEKYPFVESNINDQVILLKNILKSYGYYFVKIETSIVNNENNTIDLIYDFNLGEIAKIKKISFIGDKYFRDSKLRNVIISEEAKFWKFITKNKYLNSNRINIDEARLKNYYKNRGFFNVRIKSTTAIINENNQFELIFNINSGEKFFFNNIKIEENLDIELDSLKIFQSKLNKLKGKKYSTKAINEEIEEINSFALRNDFIFIEAKYKEFALNNNKIDIIVYFNELEKRYIERINILGNYITDEKVLRNSFIVDEGDPFNEILFNKSVQNIKSKNIFGKINYEILESENQNKIININVEEKATGEIFAGAGTGTTGSTLSAGVKENNYLGLGIQLDTNATITEESIKGKFSVKNPNYNNTDKSV